MSYDEKPLAQFAARFRRVRLWSDRIEWATITFLSRTQRDVRALTGVRASVTPGFKRVFFASPDASLTINGPGFQWPVIVKIYRLEKARTFAAHVNAAASALDGPARTATGGRVSKLAALEQLRYAGMLSDDEVAAAKEQLPHGHCPEGDEGNQGEGGALT